MRFNLRVRLGAMGWADGAKAKNSKRPRPESGPLPRQLTDGLAAWRRHSIPAAQLKKKWLQNILDPTRLCPSNGRIFRRGDRTRPLVSPAWLGNSRLHDVMERQNRMCLSDEMQQSGPKTAPSEAKRWVHIMCILMSI